MYITFHDMTIAESKLDEYVDARRRLANPAMAATGGIHGTVLLRPRKSERKLLSCVHMNMWSDHDTQQKFAASDALDEFRPIMNSLVHSMSLKTFDQVDDASIEVGHPESARTYIIVRQQCHPGRRGDYLAGFRDAVTPSTRRAPGFVGLSVLADTDDDDAVVFYFRWESDEAADSYSASQEHKSAMAGIRSLLAEHTPRARYDLVPQD